MSKYLSGDFPRDKTTTHFNPMFGDARVLVQYSLLNNRNIKLKNELKGTRLITEESARSFAHTAGWGLLGAALLGPAGLLAGALAKGNKMRNVVACELKTGEKFILGLDDDEYQYLLKKVPTQLEVEPEVNQQNQESPLDSIKKIAELKEAGIITEAEFEAKKADLLSKI